MIEAYQAARRVSTPLIAIKTMDEAATQLSIINEYPNIPQVMWDCVNGVRGINSTGRTAATSAYGQKPEEYTSPVEMLAKALGLPKETILFIHNPQLFLAQNDQTTALVIQGIKNLRDQFKIDRRTATMLGAWFIFQPEINQDIVVIDEPLPTDEQLASIVTDTYKAAKLPEPKKDLVGKAVDALRGLASFSADQVTAMSMSKEAQGIDMKMLWERKIQTVEQTPGLSIWSGQESFSTVKGYGNAQNFVTLLRDGKESFKAVLFIDEIEKHLAGATGGDLSGVKQDMLGALLTWMQDRKAEGLLFIGVPGSGKSAMAKATGNEAGVLTVSFDLAGMQESLVGKSGQNIRNALKVVDAISSGRCLVIATCNSLQAMPPELRRRFSATFFFDLPNKAGRDAIWDLYMKKYGLSKKLERPNDSNWTGAEIEKCCKLAYKLETTLEGVARFIVPVATSAPEQLRFLRTLAHNTFLNASEPGIYQWDDNATPDTSDKGRKIELQ